VSSAEIWIEDFDRDHLLESAEIVVPFLPLRGKQDGVYVTRLDPEIHVFRARLESFQFP